MKENRKLLKEVLKEIRHDMTNEEVLNLLADSKISENTSRASEKYTIGQRAENDYKVNLKTEIMIEDLYDKMNVMLAKQSALEKQLQNKNTPKASI